jgi:hypothetical protein
MVCCTRKGNGSGFKNLPKGNQSALGASCSSSSWEECKPVQEEICIAEGEL